MVFKDIILPYCVPPMSLVPGGPCHRHVVGSLFLQKAACKRMADVVCLKCMGMCVCGVCAQSPLNQKLPRCPVHFHPSFCSSCSVSSYLYQLSLAIHEV